MQYIKTGDVGLIRNRFNIKKIDTYISPFVKFFMNIQSYFKGEEICPISHCGVFVWKDGDLWFYESVSKGFVGTLVSEKFKKFNLNDLYIKRYYYLNSYDINKDIICSLKSKYNFLGIIFQLIRQLTFNIIDLEANKRGTKRLYCSQSVSYIINKISNGIYCRYWYSTDTQDVYYDKSSYFIDTNIINKYLNK